MDHTPLISVIVPVYNVEKYLPVCLDSLIGQSFRDYELILTDDGSTDRSGAICDEYAERNENIRVLHQANAGISAARNNALAVSHGTYILFADADDIVSPELLKTLYGALTAHGADIAFARCRRITDGGRTDALRSGTGQVTVLDTQEALRKILYGSIAAWNKLCRRDLVEAHPYPVGKLYEDIATTWRIFSDAGRIAWVDEVTYLYRRRSGSITRESISEAHLDAIDAAAEMRETLISRYPALAPAANDRFMSAINLVLPRILAGGRQNRALFERLREKVLPVYASVLSDKELRPPVRLRLRSIRMGYFPCRLIYPALNRISAVKKKIKRIVR